MRFVRSLGLGMKEQQFIEAARTAGTSQFQIIRRHMVPNVWDSCLSRRHLRLRLSSASKLF